MIENKRGKIMGKVKFNGMRKLINVMGAVFAAASLMGNTIVSHAAEEYYPSELTGLPISADIKEQRPIAVMVDNEKIALKHYGTAEADIVYEMMNSTANGRITRLMCIYKDWNSVPRIGSIRSIRPTNVILAGEYNAVAVHDGGPFYINDWIAKPWSANLSAGFARIKNGKPREFTEYVTTGEVSGRLAAAGYTSTYSRPLERDSHFIFNPADTLLSAAYGVQGVLPAAKVDLSAAFPHNSSKLVYNAQTMTYDYYEYGSVHTDAEDGQVMTFKNVILQAATFTQYDSHGYMIYNVIGYLPGNVASGYYITNGQAIPIMWVKNGETSITRYYDCNGQEIKLNPGKTYIGIVPFDYWGSVTVQ